MTETPQMPPPGPVPQQPPMLPAEGPPKKAAGLALAALVLGICSFVPCLGLLTAPVGAILGIVALAMGTTEKGKAAGGLATAVVGFVIGQTLMVAILLPALSHTRELAKRAICAANLHGIGQATALYVGENMDVFPPTLQHLIEAGQPEDIFVCPSDEDAEPFDYFYLATDSNAPGNTLMACDFEGNHDDYRNMLRADFSTMNVDEEEFEALLQEPQNAAFAAALREAEKRR